MREPVRSLPGKPPRPYGLRDAYNRRVWRSPGVVLGRELFFFGLVFAGLGFANDHEAMVYGGWLLMLLAVFWAVASSLFSNLRRVRLIREGPAVNGVLDGTVRVPLLHEMFRRERERTFVLKYSYRTPNGDIRLGRVWICGCARDHLQINESERVIYDPESTNRSMPLRLAMMVAPHR